MLRILLLALIAVLLASTSSRAVNKDWVVVYDGTPTKVVANEDSSADLWITMADLKKATGFVVKPQGVCREQLCFPLPKARKTEFISKEGSVSWFNLSAFAKLVKQPVARDEKNGVWYFGKREDERSTYLASLKAPNFTLPDLAGKTHSLADYRGKKVLLITWASW